MQVPSLVSQLLPNIFNSLSFPDATCKINGKNEIDSYFLNKQDFISTKEQIVIKTRQYSKRQSTWARGQMKDWQKVPSQDLTSYIKKFKKYHT